MLLNRRRTGLRLAVKHNSHTSTINRLKSIAIMYKPSIFLSIAIKSAMSHLRIDQVVDRLLRVRTCVPAARIKVEGERLLTDQIFMLCPYLTQVVNG